MSEAELIITQDIPRSTGNTFVLFSNAYNSPTVRISPSISAETGLHSVSGGLSNEKLAISWNGSGWDIQCFELSTYGQYEFNATATSNGSETLQAATSVFTFHVLLLWSDQVVNVLYYDLRVGDKLQSPLNLPAVNPILSYGVWHGRLAAPGPDDAEQYASGITLALRYDSGSQIDIPWIEGTAKRPGIYIGAIHCATDDQTIIGADGNPGGIFSGGTDIFAPVILSIKDRDFENNQLMCICKNSVNFDANLVRLVYVDDELFNSKGGNFCLKMSAGAGTWTARNEESIGYTTQVTQVDEYQIALDNVTWKLQHRRYILEDLEGADPPPYTIVSTVAQIEGSDLPPSAGWSNGAVITGDTRVFVPGDGLFDYKGTDENGDFYQQQTIHTRQYEGWDLRAEYTYAQGYILRKALINDEMVWALPDTSAEAQPGDVVEVFPQAVSGAIIPYAPPATEKYGATAVRDLAFNSLNINRDGGQLSATNDTYAGGLFPWPDERRALVPYNGTSGDVIQRFAGVTVAVKRENFYEHGEQYETTWIEGSPEYSQGVEFEKNERGLKLTWQLPEQDLKLSNRTGDFFRWLMLMDDADVAAEHTATGERSGSGANGMYVDRPGTSPEIIQTHSDAGNMHIISQTTTPSDLPSCLMFFIAGGPDPERGKWHQPYVLLKWFGGGASATYLDEFVYETTVTPTDSSYPPYVDTWTTSYNESISFNPSEFTFIPSRLDLTADSLMVDEQEEVTEQGTFNASVQKYTETYGAYDEETGSVPTESTAIDISYTLRIEIKRQFTKKGGKVVLGSASATWTRRETPAGTYTGSIADAPVTVTTGTIPDESDPDADPFEVLQEMMDAVKEDLTKCAWPTSALYGAYASGSWVYEGERNTFTITKGAQ